MNGNLALPADWRATQKRVSGKLLAWYRKAQRDLPWRRTRDPWAIWVSEIMLQQTQVLTVQGYYARFMKRFPTVEALAGADLQAVLALWAGLGYYRRAKHLYAAAREVVEKHGGVMPATAAALRTLPGVGRYTAAAIASIAYGESVAVLDGNVMRALARLGAINGDISKTITQHLLWQMAESLVPAAPDAGDHNQALMELGALICTPQGPRCGSCPVRECCRARAQGVQENLPVKGAKKAVETLRQSVLVVRDGRGAVLVLQRPEGGLWEQLWEFPVLPAVVNSRGKLADVIHKVLGLALRRVARAGSVEHALTHRHMVYQVYTSVCVESEPRVRLPRCGNAEATYLAWRWLSPAELRAGAVPLAAVVYKIAAVAEIGSR